MQDLNIDERVVKRLTEPIFCCQSLLQQDGIITFQHALRLSPLFLCSIKPSFTGA